MHILGATVNDLFDQKSVITLNFHKDLNIVTGKNGSGKTTIMKLIWYIISGQIVKALTEIPFSRVLVQTTDYTVIVVRAGANTCRVKWIVGEREYDYRDEFDEEDQELKNAEDLPNRRMRETGSSIFFPTFRRIEGGFSSKESSRSFLEDRPGRVAGDLDGALNALSKRLSTPNHRFVSALSTSDIEVLLLKQYTDASEIANNVQRLMSDKIIAEIKGFKKDKSESSSSESDDLGAAEAALDNIRSMIENMDQQRERALAQYDAIRKLVLRIFQHSGIKVGRLSLGDAAASVSSDSLSAGEKQMLSFLCYNAFYDSAVIFIDEPELSLHVDWQRQLFPTLFSQKKNNQFIIATHSPFIYTRYPEKEIILDDNRGATEMGEVDHVV